jgi:transposase
MVAVVIGVDPAKRSNTIEVIDKAETVLAAARFDNNNTDYRKMRTLVKRWPDRVWAVEGATGVELHLAQRRVADGERVLDVPSKLSTRVRAIHTGHGRKNDLNRLHQVLMELIPGGAHRRHLRLSDGGWLPGAARILPGPFRPRV